MKYIIISVLFMSVNVFPAADPSATKCVDDGYKYIHKKNPGGEYAVCVFKDGTECGVWPYFSGQCKPGQYKDWGAAQDKTVDFKIDTWQNGWTKNDQGKFDFHSNIGSRGIFSADESEGKFYYFAAFVINANRFSDEKVATTITSFKNGKVFKTYKVPPVDSNVMISRVNVIDIYVPTTNGDEVKIVVNYDKTIKEKNYENNMMKNFSKKIIDKENK